MYCTFKEFKRHEILSDAAELSTKNKNAKENLNKYLNQLSVFSTNFLLNQWFSNRASVERIRSNKQV